MNTASAIWDDKIQIFSRSHIKCTRPVWMSGISLQYLWWHLAPGFMPMNPDTTQYEQKIRLTLKVIPTLGWVSCSLVISETFLQLHSRMWHRSYRRYMSLLKQQLETRWDTLPCQKGNQLHTLRQLNQDTIDYKISLDTQRTETHTCAWIGIWDPFLPLSAKNISHHVSKSRQCLMYQDKE